MKKDVLLIMGKFVIEGNNELTKLINRSRLLGQDPNLVLYGGGNTSSKIEELDHLGNKKTVLRIKGSGADLKTIGEDGFSGLYLEELLPLINEEVMSDEEMVDYLAKCMVSATERRPSIETLLHAFLKAKHVDHVHSDAICALTNHSNGEETVKKVLGENVAFVPYLRPGFQLSKTVKQFEESYAVVLEHHGLVTWGETHEESYFKTIELEEKARKYIEQNNNVKHTEQSQEELSIEERNSLILSLRGVLSKEQRQILYVDTSQKHLSNRDDVEIIANGGRSTLEHILRIGKDSLVLSPIDNVQEKVRAFRDDYENYFDQHVERIPAGYSIHSNINPRVGLIKGWGCFGADITLSGAKRCTEIAYHTHQVAANVLDLFADIKTLSTEEIFDLDYWPLELYKLKLQPPVPSLAGYIVLFSDISNALELEVLQKVLRKGAHVVIQGEVNNEVLLLKEKYNSQIVTVKGDVNKAIQAAIDNFGGLDGVIVGEKNHLTVDELNHLNSIFKKQDLSGFVVTTQGVENSYQSISIIESKKDGLKGISELIGN